MNNLINEELNAMKYLFGYKPGRVISEQATPQVPTNPTATVTSTTPTGPATVEDAIKKIQEILKTKYKANLGTSGPNKDGIDGKWGNLTQTALDQVTAQIKSTATGTSGVAGASGSSGTSGVNPGVGSGPINPAALGTSGVAGTSGSSGTSGVAGGANQATTPQLSQQSQQALSGQLSPREIRQQSRFDQRLARQARRNERRAGQQ